MFSFLNRTKSENVNSVSETIRELKDNNNKSITSLPNDIKATTNGNDLQNEASSLELKTQLDEAKKNVYEAIMIKRTDIVVSLINEWFKSKTLNHFLHIFLKLF
jgi:hypothetical protein